MSFRIWITIWVGIIIYSFVFTGLQKAGYIEKSDIFSTMHTSGIPAALE